MGWVFAILATVGAGLAYFKVISAQTWIFDIALYYILSIWLLTRAYWYKLRKARLDDQIRYTEDLENVSFDLGQLIFKVEGLQKDNKRLVDENSDLKVALETSEDENKFLKSLLGVDKSEVS